jgi:hypothetical protein
MALDFFHQRERSEYSKQCVYDFNGIICRYRQAIRRSHYRVSLTPFLICSSCRCNNAAANLLHARKRTHNGWSLTTCVSLSRRNSASEPLRTLTADVNAFFSSTIFTLQMCGNPDMRYTQWQKWSGLIIVLNFFLLNSNPLLSGATAAQDQPLIPLLRFQMKFGRLERQLDEPTCTREEDILIPCGYNPRYIWINPTITTISVSTAEGFAGM